MPKKKDEVGFGKPPKATRFKPGQSGNPKGRPKKKRPTATSVLQDVFLEEVEVRRKGRKVKMTRLGYLANQILISATPNDPRAIANIIKLLPYLKNDSAAETNPENRAPFDKDRDLELLREFARLADFDPETQFVGDFGKLKEGEDDGSCT